MRTWFNKLLRRAPSKSRAVKICPPIIGVAEIPGNTILLDAICMVTLAAEMKVVTVSISSIVNRGVKTMLGISSKGVDPLLGISPDEAAIAVMQALENASPGIWKRVLDDVLSRAAPDVLVVHDLNRDAIQWLTERGAPIIGDGVSDLPSTVVVNEPHDLPKLADTLEAL